ncbi:mandelate racemase/muconate lactonizing enzyme family protein [Algisphaera agarilytica]|uniref:Galactonate dehydratase n=1 Tax=Algisphaera agarilytica TaxID=1385975 RepID=A0A7X0H5A0_9BACT|nr:mandelate racemase/muconate lactonizing enzyme family protein [Algisphaera agarilytica]MBB6429551.1 galactonate dehydratase [Algisphaera agarilytica]
MVDPVASVEVFTLTRQPDRPYLGSDEFDAPPNAQGYVVRTANRTVYPTFQRSVLVRCTTQQGLVGWGETYGIVAPGAVGAIINDLLAGFTIGRDPSDPAAVYDDLYDLMRVRGYSGGFYVDALAAIDIALWDIAAKQAGCTVAALISETHRNTIPAYVSGLPRRTLQERGELAVEWQGKGFDAFKFASPASDQGVATELEYLRELLGPDAQIACDLQWNHTAEHAIELIRAMEPHGLWFAEAPVLTEDIDGLAAVAETVDAPVAVGEEWRTDHDLRLRLGRCPIAIVQPEMGHTGITNFLRIGQLAAEHDLKMLPHATIGAGVFLAASLHASAALDAVAGHEFQHAVFRSNREMIDSDMACDRGLYRLPTGPGLGITPSKAAFDLLQPI